MTTITERHKRVAIHIAALNEINKHDTDLYKRCLYSIFAGRHNDILNKEDGTPDYALADLIITLNR
jgi:hypothetical protein